MLFVYVVHEAGRDDVLRTTDAGKAGIILKNGLSGKYDPKDLPTLATSKLCVSRVRT